MPGWLSALLETLQALLEPLGRWLRRFWAKRRVKKYVQELSEEQRDQLSLYHRIADENPSCLYSETINGKGGATMTEFFFYELLEEEAIVATRREDQGDGGFLQMYRFKPWFHGYLSERPELLGK